MMRGIPGGSFQTDDLFDPIVSNLAYANFLFTNANQSTTWQTHNVQAKCDLIAFDRGLHESYLKWLE